MFICIICFIISSIGPENPHWGYGQLRYLFIYLLLLISASCLDVGLLTLSSFEKWRANFFKRSSSPSLLQESSILADEVLAPSESFSALVARSSWTSKSSLSSPVLTASTLGFFVSPFKGSKFPERASRFAERYFDKQRKLRPWGTMNPPCDPGFGTN